MALGHRPGQANRVRIIGGELRGRRLAFPDVDGLRPTGDRIRETLFNWLQPVIAGARCLDLFAGSGALGFEAASRGAGRVVMLDADARVIAALKANVSALGLDNVEVQRGAAPAWLEGAAQPFDVVFLDPPFGQGLLAPCCALLESRGWLAPQARVYLEISARDDWPLLPKSWELLREQRAGRVRYGLARRRGDTLSP